MPQIINSNIASLTAQRNLNTSQSDLNTSLQRLSSGLRINSAKDDAAGLAISERFTTQIRGLNQAQRNAKAFQVGANAGETVTISSIASSRTTALGQTFEATSGTIASNTTSTALVADDLLINGTDVGVVATGGATGSFAANIATAITAADSQVSVDVGASTEVDTALANSTISDALAGVGVTFTGTAAAGTLTFTKTDGSNLNLSESRTLGTGGTPAFTGDGFAEIGTGTAAGALEAYGSITLTSASDIVVAGNNPGNIGLVAGTLSVATSGTGTTVANTDISTVNGANAAIASVDAALNTVNSSRANLGAVQNRFDSVVASIQTTSENLSASRSRIRDADFAEETAALTRAQILQQAGVSILSQANSLPQNVLALLQ